MAEEKVALPTKKSSALKDFIAGGVGGVCVVVSGYPLDTIKVKMALQLYSVNGSNEDY